MNAQATETAVTRRIEHTERVISVVQRIADRSEGSTRNHRVWKRMLHRLIGLLNRLAREAAAAEAEAKPKPQPATLHATPAAKAGTVTLAPTPVQTEAPKVTPVPSQPHQEPAVTPDNTVAPGAPVNPDPGPQNAKAEPVPAPKPAASVPPPAASQPEDQRQHPSREEFAEFGTLANAGHVISTNAMSAHSYHIGTQAIDYGTSQMMISLNEIDADLGRDQERAGDVSDREKVRASGVSDRWASDKTEEAWEEGAG